MHSGARQLPIQHLSVRLPWHDTGWAGTVCQAPSKNSWCEMSSRCEPDRVAVGGLSVEETTWCAAWRHVASSRGRRGEVGSARLGALGAARGGLGGDRERC